MLFAFEIRCSGRSRHSERLPQQRMESRDARSSGDASKRPKAWEERHEREGQAAPGSGRE